MQVKDLRPGDFFTRKPVAVPTEKQVWARCGFDRAQKKYECMNYEDANRFIYLKGETEVFTDFIF